MSCPKCQGEFDTIEIQTTSGGERSAKRCNDCGGILINKPRGLELDSVLKYESPRQLYTTNYDDLFCPNDEGNLEFEQESLRAGGAKYYRCTDCDTYFFPKGQLAEFTKNDTVPEGSFNRTKIGSAVALSTVLAVSILASVNKVGLSFEAAEVGSPLPTAGPNVFALTLLALTYLAGTILAVLGRRTAIIFMGWAVISICLFGFIVIIFGP